MSAFRIPSISAIQRTNLLLVVLFAIVLLPMRSPAASLSCALGGLIVIGNLFLLSLLGRLLLAGAAAGASSLLRAGAIPLKLLLVVGLVCLLFTRSGIDAVGFFLGTLTQLVAVLVETARASQRASADGAEVEGFKL